MNVLIPSGPYAAHRVIVNDFVKGMREVNSIPSRWIRVSKYRNPASPVQRIIRPSDAGPLENRWHYIRPVGHGVVVHALPAGAGAAHNQRHMQSGVIRRRLAIRERRAMVAHHDDHSVLFLP